MITYTVFERTAKNFEEFATAEIVEIETELTIDEARKLCKEFNDNRTEEQKQAGTKYEFTKE